ncbi:MAG: DUF454 domain-containing protein [bacterium]|nr:DUF454 domain-containing protein [bacterium]
MSEIGAKAGSFWSSPRRLLLAGVGVVCVALAFVGVFLPGLPTTIFLIAASYLFARSFPRLEERFFRIRVFRPFLPFVRGDRPLPLRARITALIVMWVAVAISLTTLAAGDRLGPWLGVAIPAAALIGSYFILTFRKSRRMGPEPTATPAREGEERSVQAFVADRGRSA